jgi:hypothetical protein
LRDVPLELAIVTLEPEPYAIMSSPEPL